MDAALYIVGTPIGNLGDISLRALETLKSAAVIMAEDTRHTHKLLARYEIRTPMISCHKFNEASRVETILEKIRAGAAVALSGFGGAGFFFEGFLSHKSAARRRRLAELAGMDIPVVLFESPYRLIKLMDEAQEVLGARELFVGRELTKQFEECLRGTPDRIKSAFEKRGVKGELVVVIRPAPRG